MTVKTNCIINGTLYYRIRKKIGEDSEGNPIVKPFYGKNKSDAERIRDEFLDKRKNGIKVENAYLGQVAKYYTYNVLLYSKKADGTKIRYESSYRNYVKDSPLIILELSNLSSSDIQNYYNDIFQKIKKENEKFKKHNIREKSPEGIIKQINRYLSGFFEYAEREGYCKNPLKNVEIPRIKRENKIEPISVFAEDEIKKILEAAKKRHNYFLFALAIGTGLREGELFALKYRDIEDGNIKVYQQISESIESVEDNKIKKTNKGVNETKTESSVRVVPIPSGLLHELETHKNKQTEKYGKQEYIFVTDRGNFLDKSNLRRAQIRLCKKADTLYREFHTYRRTYCTMLCKNGVPLQIASKLMGHASTNITAKYYTFISDSEKQSAADTLNSIFKENEEG